MREWPHRVVDKVLDGIGDRLKEISESISKPIDKGPLKEPGPHRSADALVKGYVSAIMTSGEGIMTALDKPPEELALIRRRR